MSIIPTSRGNPQASDVAIETALPMTGTSSREDLQSGLTKNDAEISKLYEDRNIQLTQGGSILYDGSGTFLTFSENLNLEINSQVAGGAPTIIPLFSGIGPYTANVPSSGDMVYVVINRILGTAVLTDSATTLPAVNSSNQEVFLIGKRDDSGDGFKRFYFRDGTAITAGQSIRLGAPSGFSLQFFASSQVTTQSTSISSVTFTTFSNSPAFMITPTVSGKYKVYASIPLENSFSGTQVVARIFNTSGGAALLYESQATVFTGASGTPIAATTAQSVYTLTAGTTYQFDIQGYAVSGSTNVNAVDCNFYMFAELCG